MSKRVPSGPSMRVTRRTEQIVVRMPRDLAAVLRARAQSAGITVAGQVVAAVRASLAPAPPEPDAQP